MSQSGVHLESSKCCACKNMPSQPATAVMQVIDDFSSKSFRLMAAAVGVIPDAQALEWTQMTQQQIEKAATNMELVCLVVLTNSVRADSKDTIHEIQER